MGLSGAGEGLAEEKTDVPDQDRGRLAPGLERLERADELEVQAELLGER